jgi:hypothetical protein
MSDTAIAARDRVCAECLASIPVQASALPTPEPPYVSTRQHTSAYASIRKHTIPVRASALATCRRAQQRARLHTSAYVGIRQHTSAYVSIRQHTSADVNRREDTWQRQRHGGAGARPRRTPASIPAPPMRRGAEHSQALALPDALLRQHLSVVPVKQVN